MELTNCRVCGGSHRQFHPVLWPQLLSDWQLSAHEAGYIDRQQGQCCTDCGGNLHSMALAAALCSHFAALASYNGSRPPAQSLLVHWRQHLILQQLSILEINEAGTLSPYLRQLPGHVPGTYPELDMGALALPDACFDLIVHSDTREHIPNPIRALQECRRVLKPGGALCMTVPAPVERMTRSRQGLPYSDHPPEPRLDYACPY